MKRLGWERGDRGKVYSRTWYRNPPPDDQGKLPPMTPLPKWCEGNGYTLYEAEELLRKQQLWAMTFKRRLYVCPNPNCPPEIK